MSLLSAIFQYAVKIICGKSDGNVLAPGEYWTAINMHNPTPMSAKFRKKIVIALPSERAGKITEFFVGRIGPDAALEIDRDDIVEYAKVRGFIKGFVVIESVVELDVVAVYTAAGSDGRVETIEVERVVPRRQTIALPDLIPVPTKPAFCNREGDALIVTVKNQGNALSGSSVTRVDFGEHGSFTVPTPPVPAGGSVNLKFPIPKGCFSPDCGFVITVDCQHQVMEKDENNNKAIGNCVG